MLQNTPDFLRVSESRDAVPLPARSAYYMAARNALDVRAILRPRKTIAALALLGLALAGLYATIRKPHYTATAEIVLNNRQLHVSSDSVVVPETVENSTFIDTQIEILGSDLVADRVIEELDLADDPEFSSLSTGLVGSMMHPIGAMVRSELAGVLPWQEDDEPAGAEPIVQSARERALATFERLSHFSRVKQTALVQVSFTSRDARKAARIVTGILRVYGEIAAADNAAAATTASAWLRDRAQQTGTSVKVVAPATVPRRPDKPGAAELLLAGLCGGLLCGLGYGFLRASVDDRIRTPEDLADTLGAECLGVMPRLVRPSARARVTPRPQHGTPVLDTRRLPLLDAAAEWPHAPFAHLLRRVRDAALEDGESTHGPLILAITAPHAGEGRSLLAFNLARLAARTDHRTLLVDGDLFDPDLSRNIAAGAGAGLVEVMRGAASLPDVLWADPRSALSFLPAAGTGAPDVDVHWSRGLARLKEQAEGRFDLVVIDGPPLVGVAGVRAMAELIDGVVLVVRRDGITRRGLCQALSGAGRLHDKFVGAVLNIGPRRVRRRLYRGPAGNREAAAAPGGVMLAVSQGPEAR